MMTMNDLARVLDASSPGSDSRFVSVSTDTRKLSADELFFAISGPNFDANEFVDKARDKGAVGAVVSRKVNATIPVIVVDDTVQALAAFASSWRQKFELPVIAITGSNGKTTTKEMTGCIMKRACGNGVVSAGNLNNHIGLPLSILALRDDSRFGVFEMGMNHPGEIEYLSEICEPTVAMINNAAAAHLEGLGSVEAVATAKSEIFSGLRSDGVAIINADDAFADIWRERAAPAHVVSFGLDAADADYRGESLSTQATDASVSEIKIQTPAGELQTTLAVLGRHNLSNAVAATACAMEAGAPMSAVVDGLSDYRPVSGRLAVHSGVGGTAVNVIDDSYNANPASVRAAIDVLVAHPGRRILVLGQMAELGADELRMHRDTGVYARDAGIDSLYAMGELARATVEGFGSGGHFFETTDALVQQLRRELEAKATTIVVKGSRSMQMERVVAALLMALGGQD